MCSLSQFNVLERHAMSKSQGAEQRSQNTGHATHNKSRTCNSESCQTQTTEAA